MKHLKLFESFDIELKIKGANYLIFEYFIYEYLNQRIYSVRKNSVTVVCKMHKSHRNVVEILYPSSRKYSSLVAPLQVKVNLDFMTELLNYLKERLLLSETIGRGYPSSSRLRTTVKEISKLGTQVFYDYLQTKWRIQSVADISISSKF